MTITIRAALPKDVRRIAELVAPFANRRILIAKDLITYFEHVQEFLVAEEEERIVGCGALHVLWEDIAEIRTLAVQSDRQGAGIGRRLLEALEARANDLGIQRLFCLTFETDFFGRHGFTEIEGTPVGVDVYQEMVLSHDDGVAEFLDLARVKPNTLGNARMLKELR